MKIYQISFRRKDNEHTGYAYVTNQKKVKTESNSAKRNDLDVSVITIDVPITKRGVLRVLNVYGGHANNG